MKAYPHLLLAYALAALAGLVIPASAAAQRAPSAQPATQRHVLIISVDGLGASLYERLAARLPLSHLPRLRRQGSYAQGVIGVYPSVTYPSHTTIVTGRMPAEHGIYSNLSSREPGKNVNDWFWFAKDIKVPTLWDVARSHHLTTASVFWPVTAGAAIDWDVPEIWDPKKPMHPDPLYVAQYATPGLLLEALQAIGPPPPGQDLDVTRTRLAAFILKKHKPNLLLVHLADLDTVEHGYGPDSPQAAATLEKSDDHIGELLAADQEAGLADSTDVFVVSDHGFLPVRTEIKPNLLLVEAGLLTADEKGNVTGGKIDTVPNDGSFFIYWPNGENLGASVDEALKPLRDQGVLWAVLDRSALDDLGADPAAQMALEAPAEYAFSGAAGGSSLVPGRRTTGTHGYLPFRRELQAMFIAWGPHIRGGVDLQTIQMTQIGPTILKAMGINDVKLGDRLPLGEIFK